MPALAIWWYSEMMRDPRSFLQFIAINFLVWGVAIVLIWKY